LSLPSSCPILTPKLLGLFIFSYLLGSIPTAVWISKAFCGFDIREKGSGNAGFTNVLRVCGLKYAIPVGIVDLLKGFIPVILAKFLYPLDYNIHVIVGLYTVLGHIFPIFASFKGGKGVFTSLGVMVGLFPVYSFVALLVFLIVFYISKIVSLSSLSATLIFVIISVIDYLKFSKYINNKIYLYFVILVGTLIFITHRSNIKRLIKGEELSFKKRKE